MLFVGYLVEQKCKSSTIRSYILAIKSVLKDDGQELCEDQFLLTSLTKACKYQNDKVITRLPINEPLLALIARETRRYFFETGQPFLAILYQALFVTAYYGLF